MIVESPLPPEIELDSTPVIAPTVVVPVLEIGGRGGLEPTRFGDWEKNGRCIDF